jgi:sec-independent protein translocase protein TatC
MHDDASTLPDDTLLGHLTELRARLIRMILAVVLGMAVSYGFAEDIYRFLVAPLADAYGAERGRLIYTGLAEAFFSYLKLALYSGFVLSFPYLAWHIYGFVAPGLYKKEKYALIPFIALAPLLFGLGMALAYYGVFPLAWHFFLSFEANALPGSLPIELETRVSEYLSLVLQLMVAFGLAFQMPLLFMLLTRVGMLKAATLKKGRRYAIVIMVAAAAFFTPPDIISQIALALPLLILYEVSIMLCQWIQPKDPPCTT